MRNTIFLLLIAVTFNVSTARPLHYKNMNVAQRKAAANRFRENLLRATTVPALQAKSTQLAERLVAQSAYMGTWALDSMQFKYHGSMGSKFNFNAMAYNTDYELDGAYPLYFQMLGLTSGQNDRPEVQADTMKTWYSDLFTPLSPLAKTEDRISLYNAASNITSLIDLYVDTPNVWNTRYLNTFNNQEAITTSVYQEYNNGWDSIEFRTFIYSNNKLVADSTSQHNGPIWEPIEKNVYQYNANGALIKATSYTYNGTGWDPAETYTMSYDASNRLSVYIDSTNGISGWETLQRDSMGYTNPNPFYTFYRDEQYSNGLLSEYTISTKHVTGGLVDTLLETSYDAAATYIDKNFTKFFYDSYNQPVTGAQYYYNDTTSQWQQASMYTWHYYYETYTLDVSDVSNPAENVLLYPNPAKNMFTLTCNGMVGKDADIEIYNSVGRLVKSLPITASKIDVDTETLPAGLYICKVTVDGQSSYRKLMLVK